MNGNVNHQALKSALFSSVKELRRMGCHVLKVTRTPARPVIEIEFPSQVLCDRAVEIDTTIEGIKRRVMATRLDCGSMVFWAERYAVANAHDYQDDGAEFAAALYLDSKQAPVFGIRKWL